MTRRATELDARIGAWVRDERIARGLTQSELAKMMEVSFQQVQKYELGSNRISASKLFLLTAAFGVDPSAVMTRVLDDPSFNRAPSWESPILSAYQGLNAANQKLVLNLAEALSTAERMSRAT